MANRATRKEILREYMARVISDIELWGGDPWPDHLWPQAAEVCEEICRRLAAEQHAQYLTDGIECRLCDEAGIVLFQIEDGVSPLHKAYKSLFELYCETETENEKLRKKLGLDHPVELDIRD